MWPVLQASVCQAGPAPHVVWGRVPGEPRTSPTPSSGSSLFHNPAPALSPSHPSYPRLPAAQMTRQAAGCSPVAAFFEAFLRTVSEAKPI